ncbi:MAG: hypothetical protein ABI353_00200 [Isosphaeraceae bacterium]
MITLTIRTLIRNAAAVFEGGYGAVTRRAAQAGCSRQTVYEHARRLERHFEPAVDESPTPTAKVTAKVTAADPSVLLDEPMRRRFAVTAFAMGISTRRIEHLFDVLIPGDGPDHATIARWVKHEAGKAEAVLKPLDAACVAHVTTLALDEVFFGGDRL